MHSDAGGDLDVGGLELGSDTVFTNVRTRVTVRVRRHFALGLDFACDQVHFLGIGIKH